MRKTLVKSEEFKDSPLGKIPKNWETPLLEEVCSLITNGYVGPTRDIYREFGIPYLVAKNIKPNSLIKEAFAFVDEAFQRTNQRSILREGDVLTVQTGFIGDSCVVPKEFDGANCHALIISRPIVQKLHPRWLSEYFNSKLGRKAFARIATGMAHPHLNSTLVRKLRIPIPPYEEQQLAAQIFDTIDSAIAHTSSLIAKLKLMKAGLLHDLLTRGLDEKGELRDAIGHPQQFKDSPLGQIPKDWEVVTVADIATDVTDGDHHTPERSDSGVFLLSARNVLNGYLALEDVDFVPEHEYQRMIRRCNPEPGDILISCSGTIGRVCEVPANFRCVLVRSAALVKLEPTRCQSRFIEAVLQSDIVQSQILMEQLQAAQPNLFQGSINCLRFALPPLNEQERISKIIDTHNNRIRTEEAYRDKLKLQKKGLMHDLLTGKVRVKDADKFTPCK